MQQWYMSYRFAVCTVKKNSPDEGQRNCPKHVQFQSKYKFEKLAHLVGFIIRIYHDPRSPERQNTALTSILAAVDGFLLNTAPTQVASLLTVSLISWFSDHS